MLWLLRHGDAADGEPDDERPLTERGVAQAQAAGRALAYLGADIEACLSSPKRRALQTAERVCEPLGVEVSVEPALAGQPFDVRELTAGLREVLLVGHDPSFSMLLHELTGARVQLKKSGLAAVANGELLVLLRPAELQAIAAANT